MNYEETLKYYSKPQVKSEIAVYCKNKWVALEGASQDGGRIFLRYSSRSKNPLTINSSEDINGAFKRFRFFKPRTVYASIDIYRQLETFEDIEEASNIAASTPIWDIDANTDSWEYALKAANIIVSYLDKEGINHSVYLKWSGRGIHIQIHEKAFSQNLLEKHNPLDVAFSVVEYVLRRTKSQLVDLAAKAPQSADRPLRVENKIDLKRVFTAPLSLHRQLDLCCVCFKPNNIFNFNLEWAETEAYRHDESWKTYEECEGDPLAGKALAEIGGYDGWPEGTHKIKPQRTVVQEETVTVELPSKKLGRFQVMGLLQAARYYLITGNLERAKSFGLNRAVFYAWAKRYARERLVQPRKGIREPAIYVTDKIMEPLGDEVAYLSPKGWFMIGNVEQTPSDYNRQITKRIEAVVSYEDAWTVAIEYQENFLKETLLAQQRFYREVYSPVRDTFNELINQALLKKKSAT